MDQGDRHLSMAAILIVEDEADTRRLLRDRLTREGYRVLEAMEGRAALAILEREPVDLILLDLMLPDIDGWEVCRVLQENPRTRAIPILILTAVQEEEAKVRGLDLGAADYLVKPFGTKELLARIRALMRRRAAPTGPVRYQVGGLMLDLDRYEVRVRGRAVELTPSEFNLLRLFMAHPHKVFSRDAMITQLWGQDCFIQEHNLDVHVHNLRRKIEENAGHPRHLVTVRGRGYKFQAS